MSFDRSFLYLRIIGHFGQATAFSDFWSVGLKLANAGGSPAPVAGYSGFLTGIKSAVQAFHIASATGVGNACFLDELTVARIGEDGHYDPDTQDTTHELYAPAIVGTGTTALPWSTALVTSLRTPRPRGIASNGRFYYPCGTLVVATTTGRLGTTQVTNYLNAAKALFDSINAQGAALSPAVKVHVMSQKGSGLSANVVTLRADGRLDQQERRENNTPSVYSSVSLI